MTILQFITPSLALISLGTTALFWRECWRANIWRERAVFWQQEAGRNARDAVRYRLHLRDCAKGGKTAAERQRAPILAKMAEIQGGSR